MYHDEEFLQWLGKLRQQASNEDPTALTKLEQLRYRAQTDGMWLAEKICGYDFQEMPHRGLFNVYLKKDPKKKLSELDPDKKNRLIIWPRDHYKTTGSAVEMVQLVLNYPNIRIYVMSAVIGEAQKRVLEVKKHFEQNPAMKLLFPEFCGKRLGSSTSFTVPARTEHLLREATVTATSPLSTGSGSHCDVYFIDDIVTDKNSRNGQQLRKTIEDFQAVQPRVAGGYIYLTGTRYAFDDAYGWMMKNIEDNSVQHWIVSLRTCWITHCKHCGHADTQHQRGICAHVGKDALCPCVNFESDEIKEVLFPKFTKRNGDPGGFTVEELEKKRLDMGEEKFSLQYENNPLSQALQKFTTELLYSHIVQDAPQIPTIVVADLAYSREKYSDESVFLVAAIKNGRIYIIDCVGGKFDPVEQINVMMKLLFKHRPVRLFIEKLPGSSEYLEMLLVQQATQLRMHLPLEFISKGNRDSAKDIRIGAVRTWLEQHRLFFLYGLPNWDKIVDQFIKWPKLTHNDYADAVAMVCERDLGLQYVQIDNNELPPFLKEQLSLNNGNPVQEESNGLPFGIIG